MGATRRIVGSPGSSARRSTGTKNPEESRAATEDRGGQKDDDEDLRAGDGEFFNYSSGIGRSIVETCFERVESSLAIAEVSFDVSKRFSRNTFFLTLSLRQCAVAERNHASDMCRERVVSFLSLKQLLCNKTIVALIISLIIFFS